MAFYRVLLLIFLFSCVVIQLFEHGLSDLNIPAAINYGKASDEIEYPPCTKRANSLQEQQKNRLVSASSSALISYVRHNKRKAENTILLVSNVVHTFIRCALPKIHDLKIHYSLPDGLNGYLIRFQRC